MSRNISGNVPSQVTIAVLMLLAGFTAPLTAASLTIVVDPAAPGASDDAAGTPQRPLATFSEACGRAAAAVRRGDTTRVLLHSGIYREAVRLNLAGQRAPLTITTTGYGETVISGSDVWDDWVELPAGLYRHEWYFRWGHAPIPRGYSKAADEIGPFTTRREMVFIGGAPLQQVLSRDRLEPGTFYVDEQGGEILLHPGVGVSLADTVVEVAVRDTLLLVENGAMVTLNGITFRHSNAPLPGTAVSFIRCRGVAVEDCRFTWNNWRGLRVAESDDVVIRNCRANDNGALGLSGWKLRNIRLSDCETARNNWRGAGGGFKRWAVAGSKWMKIHGGVFAGLRAVANRCRGLWFDVDNTGVVVREAYLADNETDGVFLEASQGPLTLENCTITDNGRDGVRLANADSIRLRNNNITGNRVQIFLAGAGREIVNWETGGRLKLFNVGLVMSGNRIEATQGDQMLFDTQVNPLKWRRFAAGMASDGNDWSHPAGGGFAVPGAIGKRISDLDGWRSATGQDRNSRYTSQ